MQPRIYIGDIMQPTSLRLFLVRHGEAVANTEMRYLGSRDDPLTERGAWQAAQLARALGGLPLAAVYTSPLRRAADTAVQIGQACELPVQVDARLREGAFGEWEGLTRAEVLARSQHDAHLLTRWETDPDCAPPGGESLGAVQARVLELVQELHTTHAGAWIVLVSHVVPIKSILCAALAVPLIVGRRLFLDPATISVIDWGRHPVVRLFNAHEHLGWDAARWMATSR